MRLKAIPFHTGRRHAAFTLAEVLVASAVLGFMVISLYTGLASGFAVVRLTREDQRASQILVQKLEAIRLCTWTQVTNFPVTFRETYNPFATPDDPEALVYAGLVEASVPSAIPISASYQNDMRLVTITVYWTNYNGRQEIVRQRQLETHVARYGMQNYSWGAGQ